MKQVSKTEDGQTPWKNGNRQERGHGEQLLRNVSQFADKLGKLEEVRSFDYLGAITTAEGRLDNIYNRPDTAVHRRSPLVNSG